MARKENSKKSKSIGNDNWVPDMFTSANEPTAINRNLQDEAIALAQAERARDVAAATAEIEQRAKERIEAAEKAAKEAQELAAAKAKQTPSPEKKTHVSVLLTDDDFKYLREVCYNRGISKNMFFKQLLDEYRRSH